MPTNKIKRALEFLYLKLIKINDTPQKISLGFGLGVFSGIIPGTGPLAALFLALTLKVNRASALLGSLLTNTWLSFVTFILAVKLGSALFGIDGQQLHQDWVSNFAGFNWAAIFKLSVLKLILPVIAGYLIIAFCSGILAYLLALIAIINLRHLSK